MLKWLLTVFIVLVILAAATPWIRRMAGRRWGFRRVPGDFEIPLRGRVYYVPFASTVALSLLVYLIGKFL